MKNLNKLQRAIYNNDIEAAKEVIQNCEIDLNYMDSKMSGSLLYYAVTLARKEIAEMLLDAGANMNSWGAGCRTALMQAVFLGHKEIIGMLLDKGADVKKKNMYSKTALAYAEQ